MSVNEVRLPKAAQAFQIKGTGPSKTFCIGDEDHTIGNALRHVLINHRDVSFAGYSVPHPSEPIVHLRVQTLDGTADATDALQSACRTLLDQAEFVLETLEQLLPDVREDRLHIEQVLMEGGYEEEEEDADPEGLNEM